MSGSLAEAVIGAQEACKIYTNSSGNPASITIHAQALDADKNSCISLKYSSTDGCIQQTSTLSTLDVPLAKTSYLSDVGNSLCGYAYTESTECKCTCPGANCFKDRHFNWCDTTDNVAYTRSQCCIRTQVWCGITGAGSQWGSLQPAANSAFGAGIQCCVRSGLYVDNLIFQKQVNIPSFITGSGETWERQKKTTYFVPRAEKNLSNNYTRCAVGVRFGQDDLCCCEALCGSRECKRRLYFCGACCFSSCYYDYACFCDFGWQSQDIWSDHAPIFFLGGSNGPVCPGANCQYFGSNFTSNLSTGLKCNYGGQQCRAHYLSQECNRNQWLECCSCWGCCCCDEWQKSTHVSNKYVVAGCDVAFFVGMSTEYSTEVILYDKKYDCGSTICQSCRMYGMYRFCVPSSQPDACCIFYPSIIAMGSPMVKWLWYNPYTDCNYFEIMGSSKANNASSPTDGIYSIDTGYAPTDGCLIGSTYSTCCYQCKTMADWIAAGMIKCISGTPTAWSEKTSAFESSTQPQLVAECCFGIWWQCFTFDSVPDEGGWNGCMFHYRSPDLINWEKVETETLQLTSSGSGNTLCSNVIKNTGSDIFKNTNHYFNSDNCVGNEGTLEYKVSANRLERTGIVLSNSDKLYVSNNSPTPVAVQIWGYDD